MSERPDFFISYTSADEQWATWIAWQLESAGYTTVIQAWDFRPGSNFVLEMDEAASAAKRTLVVLSPRFVASKFTQPEWASAFANDPTGSRRTILPVLVEPTETQGLLNQIVHIDLTGLSRDEAAAKLIAGLEPGRSKPTAEPAFPGTPAGAPHAAANRHASSLGLDWKPAERPLTAVFRDELLPSGWPRSGPATLELSLVPAETQVLRVAQLAQLAEELASAGRNAGLFSQAVAVDRAHTANVAFARTTRDRFSDESGILVTSTGQRTAWITLPHDNLGSVIDAQQAQHRIGSLVQLLAVVDAPLASRYGFTARITPLMMLSVGDARIVGNRNSASLRTFRADLFPLAMPDTVRGDALAENSDELATEAVARILAALS